MTIKAKILCLVAAFALLAIGITCLSLKTMGDYNRAIADYRHAADNALRAERLNRYMTQAGLDGRRLYMSANDAEARTVADQIDIHANQLTTMVNDWKSHLTTGELPEFPSVRDYVLAMARDGHTLAQITRINGLAAASTYGNHPQYRLTREAVQDNIDSLVTRIGNNQDASQAALARFQQKRESQFVLIAVSGIVALMAASLWIAFISILRPMRAVREAIIVVSQGAYDTPIPTDAGKGEIGALWRALAILKTHAIDAKRLSEEKLEQEHRLRELVLD